MFSVIFIFFSVTILCHSISPQHYNNDTWRISLYLCLGYLHFSMLLHKSSKKQTCLLVFHGLMSWRLPCILNLTYTNVCFLFLVTRLSVNASKNTALLLHQFCKPPNQMSQLKLFRKLYVFTIWKAHVYSCFPSTLASQK